ncbi:MAG: hemerythrin domain-containing protein [Armatimonadia bacterium]
MGNPTDRRCFMSSIALAGAGLLIGGCSRRTTPTSLAESRREGEAPEELVTPGEDLMREHGLLERVLLIYEEADRRTRAGQSALPIIAASAEIIRTFIEAYHEKLEEEYVFPVFEKAKRGVALMSTLRAQHVAGRKLTSQITDLTRSPGPQSSNQLSPLIHEFIRMYRPHAAREETVVFREFTELLDPSSYANLGDQFEEREHKLFGENGFENMVNKVAALEQQLAIYDLSQFTPR